MIEFKLLPKIFHFSETILHELFENTNTSNYLKHFFLFLSSGINLLVNNLIETLFTQISAMNCRNHKLSLERLISHYRNRF